MRKINLWNHIKDKHDWVFTLTILFIILFVLAIMLLK